jgi:chemotaxis protein CheC
VKALNKQQQSTIEEVVNIGLGRAAMSLSDIAGGEVMLSASNMSLSNINTGQALDLIKQSGGQNWVSVSQTISGDVDAVALAIFSDAKALNIVRNVLSGEQAVDLAHEYEPDVMSEVSNIILNASISALSSMMNLSLESYLPVHHFGDCESVMLDSPVLPIKLLMNLDVIIASQTISGFMSFSVNNESLQKMMQMVEQYLEGEAFEWLD